MGRDGVNLDPHHSQTNTSAGCTMPAVLLFPCLVTFTESGAIVSACKVYATPDGVDVWHWNPDQSKAEVIAHGPTLVEEDRNVWSLTCTDGTETRIVVDPKDCGCSHPLNRFRPVVPVRDYAPG